MTTIPVLEARGLTRSFGNVRALDGVDFDVHAGEVVALIGDNGAGKSTLVKALSGNLALDSGKILFAGGEVELSSPSQASSLGIETVYQDLALAPHLNAAQTMFLGREIPKPGFQGRLGFMDNKAMRTKSREAFDELGATVRSLSDPVGRMSGGQKQAIAIARAVAWAKGVIFLDEPTAALDARSEYEVFQRFSELTSGKMALFISHRFSTVRMADRIVVLENGNIAEEGSHEKLTGMGGRYAEMFELQAASYR